MPDSASAAVSATPEEVVRLWLDAAKRGDAAAMSALYTEELRTEKVTPEAYAWKVMSAGYRAVSWNGLGQGSAGKDEERRVTGHVVFRGADGVEHPENLVFRLAKRDGTWWIASIADFD